MSEHESSTASAPVTPSTGLGVIHLFCKPTPMFDPESVVAAVKAAEAAGTQVITVGILGHKCDMAVMALHENLRELRALQTGLQRAGLEVVDSYVSITEVSEYAKGMPQEMLNVRLYPVIPPEGNFTAWCFYPMSKRREGHANWYSLPFDQRKELMAEHGKSGRTFAGRIGQYITASAGLDDYEWGVTLFGVHADDLKDVVYTMRFDEGSAVYGDFGAFYTGMVTPIDELVHAI
ncbi:MAG: chlorite dismutase family protein [Ilumatobacteraceae bacterium]